MATVDLRSGELHVTVDADSDDDARKLVQLLARAFQEAGGAWMRGTIGFEDGSPDDPMVRWFPAAATQVVAHFDSPDSIENLDIPGLLGK